MDYQPFERFVLSSTRNYIKPFTIFNIWNDITTISALKSDGIRLRNYLTKHLKDKIIEEEIETIALYIELDGKI